MEQDQQQVTTDVVCGMDVTPSADAHQSEYAGTTYYFCSPGCLERFDKEPDLFTAGAATGIAEGQIADHDRALRSTVKAHVPGVDSNAPARLEQPRVESGSG